MIPGGSSHGASTSRGDGRGGVIYFKAEVLSPTVLSCVPPAVIAEGPATLDVTVDGNKSWHGELKVSYFNAAEVAVGLRPYINETNGSILIRLDPSFATATMSVSADLPCVNATWNWPHVTGAESVLPFDLSALPQAVHNDISITLDAPEIHFRATYWRRFHKVPNPPSPVEPVQVDHTTKALRVAGKLYLGVGWYISTGSLDELARNVTELSSRGVNQGMVYGLSSHPPDVQLRFLDACHAARSLLACTYYVPNGDSSLLQLPGSK